MWCIVLGLDTGDNFCFNLCSQSAYKSIPSLNHSFKYLIAFSSILLLESYILDFHLPVSILVINLFGVHKGRSRITFSTSYYRYQSSDNLSCEIIVIQCIIVTSMTSFSPYVDIMYFVFRAYAIFLFSLGWPLPPSWGPSFNLLNFSSCACVGKILPSCIFTIFITQFFYDLFCESSKSKYLCFIYCMPLIPAFELEWFFFPERIVRK